jgi:hypothetical protein
LAPVLNTKGAVNAPLEARSNLVMELEPELDTYMYTPSGSMVTPVAKLPVEAALATWDSAPLPAIE